MGIYEHPGKFQFQLFAQPPASLSRPKLAAVSVTFVKFKMRCFEKKTTDGDVRKCCCCRPGSHLCCINFLKRERKKGRDRRSGAFLIEIVTDIIHIIGIVYHYISTHLHVN